MIISLPKKIGIRPKNGKIQPKFDIFVHFGPGLAGSFGALLVGWLVVVARAVSRKTPIYFMAVTSCYFPVIWNQKKKNSQFFCFKSVCFKTLGGKFTKQLSPVRCSCHLHCPNYPPDLQMAKGGQEGQGGVILLLPFGYCYYQTVLPL